MSAPKPTDDDLRKQFPELEKAKFYRPVYVESPDGPLSAEQLAQYIWKVERAAEQLGKSEFLYLVVPRDEVERIDSRLSANARKASSKGRSTKYWPKGEVMMVTTRDGRTGEAEGWEKA